MAGGVGSSDRREFVIRNDFADLPPLVQEVHSFLEGREISAKAALGVDLVLEEVITNILKYAYRDAGSHRILIRIELTPEQVILVIEDDGRPFDPLSAPRPDTHQPLSERPIGGLGLHLVRDVAQSVSYRRHDGKNCLEVKIDRRSR